MTPFKKLILIFVLTLIAGYISMPKRIPLSFSILGVNVDRVLERKDVDINFKNINIQKEFNLVLGLDLAGGSHLVFEADVSEIEEAEKKDALESVKAVIERRVNLYGVSEPNVQTSSFQGKDRIIVELPGVHDSNQAIELIGQTAQLVFAEIDEDFTLTPTDLTGADLKSANVIFDSTSGKPVVAIEFSSEGAEKFSDITARNIGKQLAIVLDGIPVSSPVVQQQITGGSAQITGEFSIEKARSLVIQLNAGALPIPVNVVEQKIVGASLGAESVDKSIKAGVIGLAMVLFFMILTYGRLGVIANVALIIFGVLTLAIYKLIPVVLTLPGIAGFLLSVGMAVDSNILIFERFKEEIKQRPFSDALEVSFGRAWDSIRDANVATLVTAFVLANPLNWNFLHTSGPVRGFAITLAIGIAISLFTGIVVSRNLLRVFIKEGKRA